MQPGCVGVICAASSTGSGLWEFKEFVVNIEQKANPAIR
jgi:hypothetical protein